jgi:hypothetical protein
MLDPIPDVNVWSKEVVTLDPDNKLGLRFKHEFLVKMNEIDKLLGNDDVVAAVAMLSDVLKNNPGLNDEQTNRANNALLRFAPMSEGFATYAKFSPDLAKAEGLDRAKLLDKLSEAYKKAGNFSVKLGAVPPDLDAWAKDIIALDPDNKAGVRNKYMFRQYLADANNAVNAKKFVEGLNFIDLALALQGIDAETIQEGLTAKGMNYLTQRDLQKSLDFFNKALETAPQSKNAQMLRNTIQNVQQQKKNAEEQAKKAEEAKKAEQAKKDEEAKKDETKKEEGK